MVGASKYGGTDTSIGGLFLKIRYTVKVGNDEYTAALK